MKMTAIYVRRSVSDEDRGNNSLSLIQQEQDCIKMLRSDEKYKVYCDNGISGKSMDRPEFQQMIQDAKDGLISKIITYKYDRFSRNMKDFLNISDDLESYDVGLISVTEQIDTSSINGKLIRDILMRFADFERQTISMRVKASYNTKTTTTGFWPGGGKPYFGYQSSRETIGGKEGSVLVPSGKANVVKLAYQMYSKPDTSLMDILNYCVDNHIDMNVSDTSNMDRSHMSRILCNPLYVMADLSVYEYLASQGCEMRDDPSAYDGIHGVFRHKKANGSYYVKVGYHVGLVDSFTWLSVQDKKSHNHRIPNNSGAMNSFLTGLTKCGMCKSALTIHYGWNVAHTIQWRYYTDSGAYKANGCVSKRLKIKPDEVEAFVLNAMRERLNALEIVRAENKKPDTELDSIKAEIIRIDTEIQKFMNRLPDAEDVLFKLIQEEVKKLSNKKADLQESLRVRQRKHKEISLEPLRNPLNRWEVLTIQQKNALAKVMIEVVYVTNDEIDIRFSI